MGTRGWPVSVFAAACLLLAAACGGDASESSDSGRQVVEVVGLEDAFATAAHASSYRITQSNGQTLSSTALGAASKTKIDEDHPTVVGEVTPEATHITMDLTGLLRPLLGDDLETVGFEMWTVPGRVVIDTRNYAAITQINPGADLGPLEPGIAYIDVASARLDSPELIAALVGQGLPNLGQMSRRMPEVLKNVERTGNTYTGTATFTDLLGAMGMDLEQIARSAAAGVSLGVDIEPDALTDFYVNYYDDVVADVAIETDAADAVRSVRYEVDLSGVFAEMFEPGNALGLDAPDGVASAFVDTVWTLETLIRFEVVDDLEVETPPAAIDDRTDEWLAFLHNAGF